jgi:hypothetical protein
MTDEKLLGWLAAENDGRADDAEALFSALFAEGVPVLAPPDAFTELVLSAALSSREARPWAWRWVRALGACAALLMGLVLLWLVTVDPFAALQASARGLARLAADSRALFQAWLALGVSAWTVAGGVGRTALVAASSGALPFVLAANLLLASAASFGLARLLASREECL